MKQTAKEWREFLQRPGAIATCMSPSWLMEGCPKCGCKEWTVTSDCRAYCESCKAGYSTDFPFTHRCISFMDAHGDMHCLFCRGTGECNGEECQDCNGQVTVRKEETNGEELP